MGELSRTVLCGCHRAAVCGELSVFGEMLGLVDFLTINISGVEETNRKTCRLSPLLRRCMYTRNGEFVTKTRHTKKWGCECTAASLARVAHQKTGLRVHRSISCSGRTTGAPQHLLLGRTTGCTAASLARAAASLARGGESSATGRTRRSGVRPESIKFRTVPLSAEKFIVPFRGRDPPPGAVCGVYIWCDSEKCPTFYKNTPKDEENHVFHAELMRSLGATVSAARHQSDRRTFPRHQSDRRTSANIFNTVSLTFIRD